MMVQRLLLHQEGPMRPISERLGVTEFGHESALLAGSQGDCAPCTQPFGAFPGALESENSTLPNAPRIAPNE
jgi:hypothetical protein